MKINLVKVKQHFPENHLPDPVKMLRFELESCPVDIAKGARLAVAVGSRGISRIDAIIRETVRFLRKRGAKPFIFPAMGSHGGATAEGQLEVLDSLGINEKTMSVPVLSSMDVVELPRKESPVKVYMDKNAWNSDGVIMVGRVKPHTDFRGRYESGLVKMSVIGVGKHAQALAIHEHGTRGLKEIMPLAARDVFSSGKIIMGLALVENANDMLMEVRAVRTENIFDAEPALLDTARKNMPSLPVEDIDVLIVDEVGKDISGTGMDPNIIGRIYIPGQEEPESPRIKTIVLDGVTPGSHGNAIGVGFADIITENCLEQIDTRPMYENVRTSTHLERAKIPYTAENAEKAFEVALRVSGSGKLCDKRLVRIKNTLHIGELYVSKNIYTEIKDKVTKINGPSQLFHSGEFVDF